MALVNSQTATQATILSLDPSAVAANTVATETFTVKGLNPDGAVSVNAPSLTAGLVLLGATITAQDTLQLTFWNVTTQSINQASTNFVIIQH